MDWNALSAIGSAASAFVVLVGGAVAIYQLREARRASQFDATERMVYRVLEPGFDRALRFVIDDLHNRLNDAKYRAELETSRGWDVDPERHPELFVLARLEEIGIYLRHRLLVGDALLDFNAELILESWDHLKNVVALMRKSHRNPNVWSSAEYLYERARKHRGRPMAAKPGPDSTSSGNSTKFLA